MSKTFNTTQKINQVKEPLFQISRAKYRAPRSSEQENLESNLIKMDLSRIYLELQEIDESVLDDMILIVGNIEDETDETYLADGLKYEIDGIYFKIGTGYLETVSLKVPTISNLSGTLLRLFNKVKRLEMEM